jgi:hypothetical protein
MDRFFPLNPSHLHGMFASNGRYADFIGFLMVNGRFKYCIDSVKGLNLSRDARISMNRKSLLLRLIFNPEILINISRVVIIS